jgi:hypothetical protein
MANLDQAIHGGLRRLSKSFGDRTMFNWFSTVAGFLAAGLWLYASIIKVPTNIQSGFGKLVGVEEMAAGFKKQSKRPGTAMLRS